MKRLSILALVVGCAGAAGSGGGGGDGENATFSISYPEAAGATAKQGKRFYAKPAGRCLYENGREARWTMSGARVGSGELPPGLTLEDGVIGGVPTKVGSFRAKIEFSTVTCAGKPYEGQAVDVDITVK